MVEVDFVSIGIPIGIAIVVSLIIGFIKKSGNTADGTLTGTIKLEYMSKELSTIESNISKRFDKMEELIDTKEREQRNAITKVWETLEELRGDHRLNSWRLDKLEGKKGSGNSTV